MSEPVPAPSHDRLIERLEFVRCHALLGDVERSPGWVRMTMAKAPTHFRNGVLHAVLEDDQVDDRLCATIAHYTALGVPFRWDVGPSTRPRDMAERLKAVGFRYFETVEGLVGHASRFDGARHDVIEVGPERIDDYLRAMQRGWNMPPAGTARFREECELEFARPQRMTHYFVARVDGEPAGASALAMHDGFAHFSGASVDPKFRGRGAYRRMIEYRMAFLRERGMDEVTNHCVAATSAPICKRLGFERICDFDVYVYGNAVA